MRFLLKYHFGLTLEQYRKMEADQAGLCAICGLPPGGKRRLHVDHCHKTGKVRGLLCSRCNGGLGMFKDDPDLMAMAASYIKQWSREHGGGVSDGKRTTHPRPVRGMRG